MKKKILLYRNDHSANVNRKLEDGYGGVGYYRTIKPSDYINCDVVGINLTKKGESRDQRWDRIFKTYDIFWTSYFYDAEEASSMFFHKEKYGKKIVIDLDDDFLSIPSSHRLYDVMKPTKRNRAFCSTILSFADVITVSTLPLKEAIHAHIKKVYNLDKTIVVIPNMNDIKDWNFKPAPKHANKIVIGYSGSDSHYDDLKMCFPAISRIMDKYPQVHFEIMGSLNEKDAIDLFSVFSKSARDRSFLLPPTGSFKDYPKTLSKQRWDIGIAPLVDSPFTRSKSHIKYLEYSMYKIPTIASYVYPYFVPSFERDVITHEVNGLLVKPSEWFDALERLILSESERKEFGQNAYEHVRDDWQYNADFSSVIDKVIKALK